MIVSVIHTLVSGLHRTVSVFHLIVAVFHMVVSVTDITMVISKTLETALGNDDVCACNSKWSAIIRVNLGLDNLCHLLLQTLVLSEITFNKLRKIVEEKKNIAV